MRAGRLDWSDKRLDGSDKRGAAKNCGEDVGRSAEILRPIRRVTLRGATCWRRHRT